MLLFCKEYCGVSLILGMLSVCRSHNVFALLGEAYDFISEKPVITTIAKFTRGQKGHLQPYIPPYDLRPFSEPIFHCLSKTTQQNNNHGRELGGKRKNYSKKLKKKKVKKQSLIKIRNHFRLSKSANVQSIGRTSVYS